MAKKKKKEKKKKVEDDATELDKVQGLSLDDALHSAKTTETTLQSLMKEVSEEKGFVHPKGKEDEKVRPYLSHESRSKIAEAYVLEDVPIIQRKPSQKSSRSKIPKSKEMVKKSQPTTVTKKTISRPKIQVEASTVPSPGEEKISSIKKDNIYHKLSEFFEDLLIGYNDRYERWENSISNILAILRKMRKITKKNTDDLVVSINNLYKKIQTELELFKVKRDEVEKVAEVDIESMSGEFKRVLGLLELQIKEYRLKRETDDLIHELRY